MNYRIVMKCSAEKEVNRYDRDLRMNNYDSAEATFKTLVKGALENIIDPYEIEFYYGEALRYKLESFKI